MKEVTQDRAEILGEYILDTGATVRATAKVFKISKSTETMMFAPFTDIWDIAEFAIHRTTVLS